MARSKKQNKEKQSVLFIKRKDQNEPVFDKGYEPATVGQLRDNLLIPKIHKELEWDRELFNNRLQNYLAENMPKKEENEEKEENNDKKGFWYRTRSALGNTVANLFSMLPDIYGLGTGVVSYPFVKYSINKEKAPDEDPSVVGLIAQTNPGFTTGEKIERGTRNFFNINQIEDMDKTDQMINIGSMFVGPPAKAGEGLLKSMIKPGLQITKGAKLSTKAAQVGTQVGIPVGLNETSRYMGDQQGIFGDYRPKPEEQSERLVLAKRDNARQDKIYETVLFPEEKQEETFTDKAKDLGKDALLGTAIIGGTIYGGRNSKTVQKFIKNYKDAKTSRLNDTVFSNTLGTSDKILGTVNTKSIIDNANAKGFIDNDVASVLYRDTNAQTNNFFDTGIIYVGDKMIKTPVSGQYLKNELSALSIQYPKQTVFFNLFMNENRLLQNAVNQFNTLHKTNYSLSDVLHNSELYTQIKTAKGKNAIQSFELINKLHKRIQKDGVYTKPLQEMSDINNAILDVGLSTGEFSPQMVQNLKNNKTLFDLNIHLPGIKEKPNTKGFNKLFSGTFDTDSYKLSNYFSLNKRSSDKTALEVAPFIETFETNFKNSVHNLLKNENKSRLVDNLLKNRDKNVVKLVDDINDIKNQPKNGNNIDTLFDTGKQIDENVDKITKNFSNIDYIGEIDTNVDYKAGNIVPNKNPLLNILNKNKKEYGQLEKSINASLDNKEVQNVLEGYLNGNLSPEYVVIPRDGKLRIYKVDKWLGKIIQDDPKKAEFIYSVMKGLTDTMKTFVTGPMNRFFAPITTAYTSTDQMLARNLLNKDLDANLTKTSMLKNAVSAGKDAFSFRTNADKLNKLFTDVKVGKKSYNDVLTEADKLQKSIQDNPISHIKATGANLQTRYPVNYKTAVDDNVNPSYFRVNSQKVLDNLRNTINKNSLVNNKVVNSTQDVLSTGLDYAKNILDSMRDAPTLGIYKNLSSKFMKDGKLDPKKILEISRSLEKNTATGKITPSKDKFGKVAQWGNDLFPYFSDMLSENLARGKQIGLKNIPQRIIDLFDNDVELKTALKNIKNGTINNDFIKASIEMTAIPVALAGLWNHANQENEDAYNSLPKQIKNKGIVLANVVNGQPIVIPMTQSLMWAITALREGVIDPTLKNGENKFNPKETFGSRLADTAELNWGISTPPIFGLMINAFGYRAPNVTELAFDSATEKYPLEKYKLKNADYSDNNEYYENGFFSAKQRAMLQTLFGNFGGAVTESVDQTIKNKSLADGVDAFVNEYPKSLINLFDPKLSSWDETSGYIYKRDADIRKLQHIPENKLTQQQKNVRHLINMYQNSRLNEIEKQIKALNRKVTEIRSTGKSSTGEDLSAHERKENINDLIKQQKLLRAYKVKAYEQLDTLLKQGYGITYDDFMKGIK